MGRPRTFDEPQVLRQAREVFHDHGYTATSVDQLSEATGLNRSSLYGTFGDKHTLFLACFALYCEEQGALLDAELGGDQAGALARLRGHMRAKTRDPAESRRGCLLAKTTAELASDDPEVARRAKAFYARYESALRECIAQAQAVGDLREDIANSDAAAMVLATLRGIEALGRAGVSKQALRSIAETTLSALTPPAAQHS